MAQAGMFKLEPHPARDAALAEIHARPFAPMVTPGRVLHFAFAVDAPATSGAARELADLARSRGLPPIDEGARQVTIELAPARLIFEPHGEFLTYTWIFPGQGAPFRPRAERTGQRHDADAPTWPAAGAIGASSSSAIYYCRAWSR